MLFAYQKVLAEVQEKIFLELAARKCSVDHPPGGFICPHCTGNLYMSIINLSFYLVLYLIGMGRNTARF